MTRIEKELLKKLDQASVLYNNLETTMNSIAEQSANLNSIVDCQKVNINYLFESMNVVKQVFRQLSTTHPIYQQAFNSFNQIGLQHEQNQAKFKKHPNKPSKQQQVQQSLQQQPQPYQQQTRPEKQQFQPQQQNAPLPQQQENQTQQQHTQINQQSMHQQL